MWPERKRVNLVRPVPGPTPSIVQWKGAVWRRPPHQRVPNFNARLCALPLQPCTLLPPQAHCNQSDSRLVATEPTTRKPCFIPSFAGPPHPAIFSNVYLCGPNQQVPSDVLSVETLARS